MPWQEFKDKYKGRTPRARINRAIRAECAGGSECLDAINHFLLMSQSIERRIDTGANDLALGEKYNVALEAHERLVSIRDAMSAAVKRRWDFELENEE